MYAARPSFQIAARKETTKALDGLADEWGGKNASVRRAV